MAVAATASTTSLDMDLLWNRGKKSPVPPGRLMLQRTVSCISSISTTLPMLLPPECTAVPPPRNRVNSWKPKFQHLEEVRSNGRNNPLDLYPSAVSSKDTDGSLWELEEHGAAAEKNPANPTKVFNVSGTMFLVQMKIFSNYPDTLLGSEALECFYRRSRDQYFIEHNKHVFPAVIRFYTHREELVCPPCFPKQMFEESMEFYGLLLYYKGLKTALVPPPEPLKHKNRRELVLFTLQYPTFSTFAKVYAIFDILIIIMSTFMLVIESIPELIALDDFMTVAYCIEIGVNVYFTVQAVILLAVYDSWRSYFKNLHNWVDIASILPFYMKTIAGSYFKQVGGFRVLRVVRLLRVMKLFRHSQGSQTMITFLFSSLPEIMLLLLMWGIGVLIFGPLIYFIEHENGEHDHGEFRSAFSGMWFCVVTIGTVGYGDLSPTSNLGKFVSALYAILNLTVMTIPISIIITKFSRSMKVAKK